MSATPRKYATIKHPTIEALTGGHYRYKEHAQALARFNSIAKNFVLSKEPSESTKMAPAVILWIKGFALTEAETIAGYTGHFAEMRLTKRKDDLYTLTAAKLDRPLSIHPQKKRPTDKHPNWGHPVMRAVKRKKTYATLEAAQAELELLHLEFPEVTIPGGTKLYVIVYEKRADSKRPTHKIALEIELQTGGGFIISARDNEKSATSKSGSLAAENSEQAAPGHFASTEALRKANRRKRVTANIVEVSESDTGKFSATENERLKRKKKKQPPRVTASAPASDEEAAAQARFRAAEEEREKRRRRRTTLLDITIKAKRDKKP